MHLNDLYKKIKDVPVAEFPSSALSGLLHGYLSIYSLVRVNPWLESVYGSIWDIHERLREIAGELADLVNDPSVTLEERVTHIADLMETYVMYADLDFLDIALDAAYRIISREESEKVVLSYQTPEMCRLLCSCYYFTGEERCAELAGMILREWEAGDGEEIDAWEWDRATEFYENTVGGVSCPARDRSVFVLSGKNIYDQFAGEELCGDLNRLTFCFEVLAKRECEEDR